jgi:aminoglycoside phosphotransferase (APT) family kinase protein
MHETQPVRPGEEIDAERLSAFLRKHAGFGAGNISVEQFPAGSSNLTYLVRAGDIESVLRRPPFGNTVKTAHDMRREYSVLSKLSAVYPLAPKPLLFCDDERVIGSEFYLMERRRGLIIRGELPAGQMPGSPDAPIEMCRSFMRNLADLHSLDYAAAGLANLGRPDGYNRRQVEGWTRRYFAAKTHEWPQLECAIRWLSEHMPAESGSALIHNDYKFDNIVLDSNNFSRITAVLDWEMVTIGDPLMDLGATLGYWMSADAGEEMLSMPFNPRMLMENVSRRELVEMYADASGRDVADMVFYYVFGTFKIAVIAQQIYVRYVKGSTTDKRFANFHLFVNALGCIAEGAIAKGSI